jgi:hypothetical protein
LTTKREKQLAIFEALTMFQQRILCHRLPTSLFDKDDIPLESDDLKMDVNKVNKQRQESKRQRIGVEFKRFETDIQASEHAYQRELSSFELELKKTTTTQCSVPNDNNQVDALLQCLRVYLNQKTATCLRSIRYRESRFHSKLLRRRNRDSSSSSKPKIDVYPRVIVDVDKVLLTGAQLDFLSRNGQLNVCSFETKFLSLPFV